MQNKCKMNNDILKKQSWVSSQNVKDGSTTENKFS